MSRWLLPKDQVIVEPNIELLSEKEYTCTPDNKVMSLPGARSVYDLNEDYENELAKHRESSWATGEPRGPVGRSATGGRHRKAADLPKPRVETVDTIARTGTRSRSW